jgi:hypothetical protein
VTYHPRLAQPPAKHSAPNEGKPDPMNRLLILIFTIFLGVVVAGLLILGAFPPHAHRQPVEHVLQNDKFQGH